MMVFGSSKKPMILGYSGYSVYFQTLHLLFVIYERMKGAVEGFIHFGTVLAVIKS
jgi:hypothetical protein